MNLIVLAISAILINNFILTRFLGICPFLGVSRKISSALGMSLALILVVFSSAMLSYGFYFLVLKPLGLEYLYLVSFILIIASFVQFVEMFMKKYMVGLYKALGIYLPLITTNCVVLTVAIDVATKTNGITGVGFTFPEAIVYSLAVPVGYMIILILFSAMQEKLQINSKVPAPFKGNGIALVTAALMALAFAGFGGLI